MGLVKRGGTWSFVLRVPRRYAHLDRRQQVRVALGTDSKAEAQARAPAVEAEVRAYWQALEAGEAPDALDRLAAARALCAARGLRYRPAAELAEPDALGDLVARARSLAAPGGRVAPAAEVEAVLGLVDAPGLTMTGALARFLELTRDRLDGKSERQAKRWRNDRERAVGYFCEAVGDKPLAEITRDDALAFRAWWQAKIEREGRDPETANKSMGHLADVFRTVSEGLALGLDSPFGGLRLRPRAWRAEVPPFSPDWIRDRLLAPGALARLNEDARLPFLALVNTGCRPSEVLGARVEDFRLAGNVPHLAVLPYPGRTLKTRQAAREVPLVGVSLEAARAIVDRGGIGERYALRGDVWSAAVNKYLAGNGLRETDAHTVYSLRHAFEDRLLEAGVDDRIRAELMGHKYDRPAYGRGGSLEVKAEAVGRIAF